MSLKLQCRIDDLLTRSSAVLALNEQSFLNDFASDLLDAHDGDSQVADFITGKIVDYEYACVAFNILRLWVCMQLFGYCIASEVLNAPIRNFS